MPRPSLGPSIVRSFAIPVDLDDWLEQRARPGGPDSYCPAGKSKRETVVLALQLFRELSDGVPSPASQTVLADALSRLDA